MVQAFSLPSSGLSYFIGYSLVHTDHIAICSPWLSDVELRFPVTDKLPNRRLSLSQAIRELETAVDFYVRAGEQHNDYMRSLVSRMETTSMTLIDDLHAKAVVTSELVYIGSANITHSGLTVNRELCEIVENEYGGVSAYLDTELGL
jgi:hypothetical protein